MTEHVLVIDDDETFNAILTRALLRRGFEVSSAHFAEEALDMARERTPDAAVMDLNLGSASGLSLIRPLLGVAPNCAIIVLTGYASIATAVEAIKLGAVQYFAKPIEIDAIVAAIASNQNPEKTESEEALLVPGDPLSVGRLEWEHIQRVLLEHDGNISATARSLKMHRRTLQRKLAKRPAKG